MQSRMRFEAGANEMKRRWAAIRRGERGQSVVEFALAMPFLIMFVLFITDVGFLAYSHISVTGAVREGARCGAVGGTDAAIEARVDEASGGLANFTGVTDITRGPAVGDDIEVEAEYSYDWVTPVGLVPGLGGSLTFTRSVTMRMETVAPYTLAECG